MTARKTWLKVLRSLMIVFVLMFGITLSVNAKGLKEDIPVLTADTDGVYRYVYNGAENGKEYLLAVLSGLYDSTDGLDLDRSADSILYIDQQEAGTAGVKFEISLKEYRTSTVIIVGESMSKPVIVGYITERETAAGTADIGYTGLPQEIVVEAPTNSDMTAAADSSVAAEDKSTATADESGTMTAEVTASGNVELSWTKQSGAQSYTVYQYKNGKYVKLVTTADTAYTVKGLANGRTYKFMVRAQVNGRLTPAENSLKVSVNVCRKPAVKLTAGKGSITLRWSKIEGAEKYRVYKLVNNKLKLVTETEKLSVKINGTKAGKTYAYAVKAYADGKWTSVKTGDIVSITV